MNDTKTFCPSERLVAKICGLTSLKGEDILLQNPSEIPVRYHRLRSSLPAKLWSGVPLQGGNGPGIQSTLMCWKPEQYSPPLSGGFYRESNVVSDAFIWSIA